MFCTEQLNFYSKFEAFVHLHSLFLVGQFWLNECISNDSIKRNSKSYSLNVCLRLEYNFELAIISNY